MTDSPGPAASGTTTVLLVDDEEIVLHALERQLRGQPYRVVTTQDPRRGLELIATEGVDVLVSDLDMPGLNGIELCAQARALHPEVVRVLLTGHACLPTALRAINEGEVFRFLAKPWRPEELLDVLREAAKRRGEPRRRPSSPEGVDVRRAQRLAALEREHPGITAVQRPRGVHVIDERRLEAIAALLGGPFGPNASPDRDR